MGRCSHCKQEFERIHLIICRRTSSLTGISKEYYLCRPCRSKASSTNYQKYKAKKLPKEKGYKDYVKEDKEFSLKKYGAWIRLDEMRFDKFKFKK